MPQAVAMQSKPAMMIPHSPGCVFITDTKARYLMHYRGKAESSVDSAFLCAFSHK